MLDRRIFVKYWLPPFIWMAVIFSASSDQGSFQHSSRIIGPLLHWLFPKLSNDTMHFIVLIFRKGAHLTEYAILALLFWRAIRKPVKNDTRPWSWQESRNAVLWVAGYATTDEFHQLFVPSREAAIHDVVIDTTGGAIGLLLLWGLGRWRKWW